MGEPVNGWDKIEKLDRKARPKREKENDLLVRWMHMAVGFLQRIGTETEGEDWVFVREIDDWVLR